MAFGNSQQQSDSGSGGKSISFERRDLTFQNEQAKKTTNGKPFWRVQDNHGNGRWYSVWEEGLLETLHSMQEAGGTVPCCVKIEKKADSTFYTITYAGENVDSVVETAKAQEQTNAQPGGKNSEYGKRMHPDDALRVTTLAHEERAIQIISLLMPDKPADVSSEQFIKGKFLGIMNFLAGFTSNPNTVTPDSPAMKTEESPATQQAAASGPDDDDIPF
jgi:hypothetical protein